LSICWSVNPEWFSWKEPKEEHGVENMNETCEESLEVSPSRKIATSEAGIGTDLFLLQ
jgi:hypothetical protein